MPAGICHANGGATLTRDRADRLWIGPHGEAAAGGAPEIEGRKGRRRTRNAVSLQCTLAYPVLIELNTPGGQPIACWDDAPGDSMRYSSGHAPVVGPRVGSVSTAGPTTIHSIRRSRPCRSPFD
jgi:hypothetical protein